MIIKYIFELIEYGIDRGLIEEDDRIYTANRLFELFGIEDPGENVGDFQKEISNQIPKSNRKLHEILSDITDYAVAAKLIEDDTVTQRDLFDTKVMGLITPMPSKVRAGFKRRYEASPTEATDYYYKLSKATNYIREDRIAKDEKWVCDTEYGPMDITINLSKPEKNPKDIAKAGASKAGGYPKCLLCMENEGYAGNLSKPARQNHRIVPIQLNGEDYFLQYSPYVYYNEHCIIFNKQHIPMKIDKAVFRKLLDFVGQFPHYIAGSNADLPIVGGSILSHDHFQGGRYEFAMLKAPIEREFIIEGFEDINAGIVKWPMSVIRISSSNSDRLAEASDMILTKWRGYTDEKAFIYSRTDADHNTITPIAVKRGERFELNLVLRNNITTPESPWGVYHPSEDLHHIKKENIGLIEVMGLAILPPRMKTELERLADFLVKGLDPATDEELKKHAEWASEIKNKYNITTENVYEILREETGKVFVKVLECAGVYKRTAEGAEAFDRFASCLKG